MDTNSTLTTLNFLRGIVRVGLQKTKWRSWKLLRVLRTNEQVHHCNYGKSLCLEMPKHSFEIILVNKITTTLNIVLFAFALSIYIFSLLFL